MLNSGSHFVVLCKIRPFYSMNVELRWRCELNWPDQQRSFLSQFSVRWSAGLPGVSSKLERKRIKLNFLSILPLRTWSLLWAKRSNKIVLCKLIDRNFHHNKHPNTGKKCVSWVVWRWIYLTSLCDTLLGSRRVYMYIRLCFPMRLWVWWSALSRVLSSSFPFVSPNLRHFKLRSTCKELLSARWEREREREG